MKQYWRVFNLVILQNHQFTKLKTSPKFPATWYILGIYPPSSAIKTNNYMIAKITSLCRLCGLKSSRMYLGGLTDFHVTVAGHICAHQSVYRISRGLIVYGNKILEIRPSLRVAKKENPAYCECLLY